MRSLLAAGAVSALVIAFGARAQEATYDASTVLARVNGTEITLGHVIILRDSLPQQYQQLPDEMLLPGLVEQLVDQTLLANEASASPETDPLAVKLRLENERRGALATRAVEADFANPLDPAAVEAAYQAAIADFAPETEYNASHILVADEAAAVALKEQIDGGADFAALAAENSTDPGSAANGGLLGWFGMGRMVPEFEAGVAGLEVGQVSDPVQSQFGWHIIKLNETRETSAPTLDEVRPEVENQLRQEALQARLTALREGATVEIDVDGVPPAAIRESDLVAN
jgi:peptidyl-prolyl cis-trans isomerase C